MSIPPPGLVDALYREEVDRARAMSPADKLLEGPRLFARACRLMADGIRHQHPELDDATVAALLRARLERLRTVGPDVTPDEAVVAVIDALERSHVPYMTVGSVTTVT